MRDGEIAAQKAALSKALSAAYLEHQIADLETRVNAIGVNGDARVGGSGGHHGVPPPEGARGTHGAIGDGAPRRSPMASGHASGPVSPRAPGGPLFKSHPASPGMPSVPNHAATSPPAPAPPAEGVERASRSQRSAGTRDEVERVARIDGSDDSDSDGPDAWRVAVVDVSALMWAPRSVRALLQRGGEVIVPLDALRTLDMLKKGGSAAAVAARAAARFVEHASRHWRPISADPSIAVQAGTNYKRGRGLRLQHEAEERSLDDAESDTPPPKWVASVLGCAAFFSVIARAEDKWDEHPAVLIAHPPLSAEVGPNPVDERRKPGAGPAPPHAPGAEPQGTTVADRAEGYTLSLEAGRFELRLEVLRDEDGDEDVPRPRRRNNRNENAPERGRGARGRGRGRGGRGAAAGNAGTSAAAPDSEPVRILLRRHDEAQGGPAPAAAPPPHMPPPPPPHHVSAMPATPQPQQPTATPSTHPVLTPPDAPRGRGGARGRGSRGRGRGGGERNTDRGGGFTLLQRPGPPLAHHVRDVGEVERGGAGGASVGVGASGSGSGGIKNRRDRGGETSRDRRGGGGGATSGQWRRAYATNDEAPRTQAPKHSQQGKPPAEREREREQPRVVLLQRPR